MRAPMASICARACSSVTPGFSLAKAPNQWKLRVMFCGLERQRPPDLGVGPVERAARRQHADHGVRLAVQANRAADDLRIGAELRLPEHVAEHGDVVLARLVLVGAQTSGPSAAWMPKISK